MLSLTAQSLVLAAEEESGGGGIALLLPETAELIAGIIAFAIVFFFMWKWAFPAIGRALEARRQAIQGQLEEAERAKAEAESLLEDYRAQLAEARSEAARIVEDARQTAEQIRSEAVAKAKAEAEEIVRKAREEAEAERQRALEEARQEVANLTIDLAEKVVAQALDREAQRRLIEQYLAELTAGGE